jgi:hypothetical protein
MRNGELANQIIAYENGEMNFEEVLDFFQHLVDNGLAWQLQGHYGRVAEGLIMEGEITNPLLGEEN